MSTSRIVPAAEEGGAAGGGGAAGDDGAANETNGGTTGSNILHVLIMRRLGLQPNRALEPRLWRQYHASWARANGCTFERELSAGRYGSVALYKVRNSDQRIAVKSLPAVQDRRRATRDKELFSITYATHMYRMLQRMPGNGWSPFVAATLDATLPLARDDPYSTVQVVMEFVPGRALDTVDTPQPQVLYNVLADLLQGVTFLHKLHMAHRDIKGANVILTDESDRWRGPNRALLVDLDFSCVSLTDKSFKATRCTSILGSPLFMSPAVQAMSIPLLSEFFADFTPQDVIYMLQSNDVWAIGVTAVEYYAGRQRREPARIVLATQAAYEPPEFVDPDETQAERTNAINTMLRALFQLEPFEEAMLGAVDMTALGVDELFTRRNAEHLSNQMLPLDVLDETARPVYAPYVCGGDHAM